MRNLSLLASAVALASVSAMAQTVSVPSDALIGGYGTSANYFRAGTNRFQMVYDSTHFTSQGILAPVSISQIDFEVYTAATFTIVNFPQVDIYLEFAAVDYSAQSTTFASNFINPTPVPVFSGPVTTQAGTYYVSIPLTTPVSYDPTAGIDLVLDVVIPTAPTPLTGNTQWCAYSATPPGNLCSVIRSVGQPTSATGSYSGYVPIVQFTYTPDPNAGVAVPTGTGCISKFASMYELFDPTANFDLHNSALAFLWNGTSYDVARVGTYLPIGSVNPVPTALTLADDAEVFVPFTTGSFPGWTGLNVCSNGYVAAASGNTLTAAPSANNCMNNPQMAFYSQRDLDPSSGGQILFEESPGLTMVTYDGVPNWDGGTGAAPCDIQFQFYSNGDVFIAWGANMSTNQDNGGILVGYSPGGTSLVPASTDITSITGVLALEAADTYPLTLTSATRPVINTTWNLDVTNIPALIQIGIEIYGFSDPNIPDMFFIGMPGCPLRASLDLLNPWVSIGQTTHSYSLPVPNVPTLLGANIYLQSAMMDASYNAFGLITSNGIAGTIGSI
ncbi:MAG: hypothetical protein IT455_00785 [Planctomycetes bacterium]|nr:hypothetical protein [Planctomycetota bacterium]